MPARFKPSTMRMRPPMTRSVGMYAESPDAAYVAVTPRRVKTVPKPAT
jgi:hypothetical protein